MKCLNCGYENDESSKFCASCGNPLEASGEGSQKLEAEAGLQEDLPNEGEGDSAAEAAPEPAPNDNERSDSLESESPEKASAAAAGDGENAETIAEKDGFSGVKNKLSQLDKKAKMAIVAAVAAVVIVVIVFVATSNAKPNAEQVKSDIESSASFVTAGDFDADAAFTIDAVEDMTMESESVPSSYQGLVGGSEMAHATCAVEASNGFVEASGTGSVYYSKSDSGWVCMLSSLDDVSYTATAGVQEEKIEAQAKSILYKADSSNSLTTIYQDADVKVGKVKFDEEAQTCTVDVTYTASAAFSDAEATIAANFAFADGHWTLSSAQADANADNISYDKLIGTWTGKFKETWAGQSNCYGAQDKEFKLVISSIDSTSKKVEGSYSGLAHYHERLESDANASDGDQMVENQAFTATLKEGYLSMMSERYKIGAECTSPEDASGQLSLAFGFGTADDPNAAVAVLETEHDYKGQLNITYSSTTRDTYVLTKAE